MQGCNLILAEILDDSARLRKEPSVLWWVFSTFYVERNFIALRVVQSKFLTGNSGFSSSFTFKDSPGVFFPFDQVCESSTCPFCLSLLLPALPWQPALLSQELSHLQGQQSKQAESPLHQPVNWETGVE